MNQGPRDSPASSALPMVYENSVAMGRTSNRPIASATESQISSFLLRVESVRLAFHNPHVPIEPAMPATIGAAVSCPRDNPNTPTTKSTVAGTAPKNR